MPKPKGGLGRGLGALIPTEPPRPAPEEVSAPAETNERPAPAVAPQEVALEQTAQRLGLIDVSVGAISPNPRQPRQGIDATGLDGLAESIREHGILQPLVVTRTGPDSYNLIAGERRWRAAELAGLELVPVIVKEATSEEMLELALVENLQRADLNPLEEAMAFRSLVEEFGLRQEDVAARVGRSRQAVANSLRLLRLPLQVQESLALGLITEGHARALLQVPDEREMLRLLEHAVAEGLSVRQVEALARRLAERAGKPEEQAEQEQSQKVTPLYDEVRALEDRFRTALGTRVQLSRSRRGGRLVIYFYSDEELDRIYSTIVGEEE